MTGFRKAAVNVVLWSTAVGSLLGIPSSVAVGADELVAEDRCAAVWQEVAIDRTDGYLSEREAAPYLAVLRGNGQAPDKAISRAEFIAACRSGAIPLVVPARMGGLGAPAGTTRRMICEMPED